MKNFFKLIGTQSRRLYIIALVAIIGLSIAACDYGGDDGNQGTAPVITTQTLPDGAVGKAYGFKLEATGDAPITWSVENGELLSGLTLFPDGIISGTPETEGTATFTVKATNKAGSVTKSFFITTESAVINAFKTWLDAQPDNTAETAYYITLEIDNESDLMKLSNILILAANKYVFLDLSGSTITTIPNNAFSYMPLDGYMTLVGITIPDSVTSIGDAAFSFCTRLTSITIPDSVTYLSGFRGCDGLTSITIPNSVTTIGNRAFEGCDGLTSVTIPDSVTTIGDWAFSGCSELTSVTIPDSVTTIGDGAFSLGGLTSVTIPDSVTTIGAWAFSYCSGLTSVTIGSGVTTIGDWAFSGCGFTSITIPNSVTTIGAWAFSGCSGLTSVNIPNSVTTIGDAAFSSSGLTSVTVDVSNPNYSSKDGILYNKGKTKIILVPQRTTGDFTIPNSVTTIGNYAFYCCTGLGSVTIPNTVTTIGNRAFSSCISLTSVTIPNSVTTIGVEAFAYCNELTSVTISNSVTTIGNLAFGYCYQLTSVTFAAESNIANANFGNNAFPEGSGGDGGNNLKTAYLAASPKAGTYTRSYDSSTWTKQP